MTMEKERHDIIVASSMAQLPIRHCFLALVGQCVARSDADYTSLIEPLMDLADKATDIEKKAKVKHGNRTT